MNRIKYMEQINVVGIQFTIHTMESLSYDGEWQIFGFDVYWGKDLENKKWFFSYSTTNDLKKLVEAS